VSRAFHNTSPLSFLPARAKFFNFCGLPTARLDADQTVYKKKKKNKLVLVLSWAFNVAMFGAPQSHMEELRRVWVDRSINSPRWKNFNSKLSNEWSSITIYVRATILAVRLLFCLFMPVNCDGSRGCQLSGRAFRQYPGFGFGHNY
jgi:hypothetical protein